MKSQNPYHVFDNNVPATWEACIRSVQNPSDEFKKTWETNKFATFEEAREYAMNWLGIYSPPVESFKINTPLIYCMGCEIEIRKID